VIKYPFGKYRSSQRHRDKYLSQVPGTSLTVKGCLAAVCTVYRFSDNHCSSDARLWLERVLVACVGRPSRTRDTRYKYSQVPLAPPRRPLMTMRYGLRLARARLAAGLLACHCLGKALVPARISHVPALVRAINLFLQ